MSPSTSLSADTNWPTKWRVRPWRGEISASCIMPGRSPTALWVKETPVSKSANTTHPDHFGMTQSLFWFHSRFPGQKQWPLVQKPKRCKSANSQFAHNRKCTSGNARVRWSYLQTHLLTADLPVQKCHSSGVLFNTGSRQQAKARNSEYSSLCSLNAHFSITSDACWPICATTSIR